MNDAHTESSLRKPGESDKEWVDRLANDAKPSTLEERLAYLAVAQHGYALLAKFDDVTGYLECINDAPLTDAVEQCLSELRKAMAEVIMQMVRELNTVHGAHWMDDHLPDEFCD